MPKKISRLYKIEAEQLKFDSENLPTLEQVLGHGQFLRETKYPNIQTSKSGQKYGQKVKWGLIAIDVAQKLRQIWIQDFGIPERCLRTVMSVQKSLKDQFSRINTKNPGKPDLQLVWMAKFGTIIEPLKCRCKIESNPSQSEFYHQVCQCQDLYKIPLEKLEFLFKQRERSQSVRESVLSDLSESRKMKNLKKKMIKEEALRVKKEKNSAWNEWKKERPVSFKTNTNTTKKKSSNSIFLSQQRSRHIKKEPVEELCTFDASSLLISDIEVSQNSIKTEIEPDIKEEKFEL